MCITPKKAANKKTFSFYKDEFQETCDAADIIITYNGTNFDDSFLETAGIKIPAVAQFDVMLNFV